MTVLLTNEVLMPQPLLQDPCSTDLSAGLSSAGFHVQWKPKRGRVKAVSALNTKHGVVCGGAYQPCEVCFLDGTKKEANRKKIQLVQFCVCLLTQDKTQRSYSFPKGNKAKCRSQSAPVQSASSPSSLFEKRCAIAQDSHLQARLGLSPLYTCRQFLLGSFYWCLSLPALTLCWFF